MYDMKMVIQLMFTVFVVFEHRRTKLIVIRKTVIHLIFNFTLE